jgi:hypothetical protein
LTELRLGSDVAAWTRLGFRAEDGAIALGATRLRPVGGGGGILGWTVAGLASYDLDGLVTENAGAVPAPGRADHPNGATRIDHVVVRTPRFDTTVAALERAGLELRRVREPAPGVRQGFIWVGDTILELVEDPRADAPAFWGLVVVVEDIERAAAELGDLLGRVKPAVQSGRSIATVREDAGIGMPLALMTPHVKQAAA